MNYVRNAWYVACWAKDVEAGQPLAVTILGEPLVLWRSAGELVAFEDRCAHRFAPLSRGRCEGSNLRCMYHGLLFGPDGKALEIPGQKVVPPHVRVQRYPVVERHSWAWVWMGDPEQADDMLIPPAVGLEHPDWVLGHGYLDYAAEASLINDNLLDFSHLTYVHSASFGADDAWAGTPPRWEELPRGLRYARWVENTADPVGGRYSGQPVDDYLTYDFYVPGVLVMWNGSFTTGTAKACSYGRPDFAQAVAGVATSSQAVTPVDTGRARYFFSAGPHRAHGDEKLRDIQLEMALKAFEEDRGMIEAQQKIINKNSDQVVKATAHDRGIVLFTRLVDRLIDAEKDTIIMSQRRQRDV